MEYDSDMCSLITTYDHGGLFIGMVRRGEYLRLLHVCWCRKRGIGLDHKVYLRYDSTSWVLFDVTSELRGGPAAGKAQNQQIYTRLHRVFGEGATGMVV